MSLKNEVSMDTLHFDTSMGHITVQCQGIYAHFMGFTKLPSLPISGRFSRKDIKDALHQLEEVRTLLREVVAHLEG